MMTERRVIGSNARLTSPLNRAKLQLVPYNRRLITAGSGLRIQAVGPLGGRVDVVVSAGSRIFVRLVALSTPMPMRTIAPTPIHIAGTLSR